jgi:hypothetical protein
MSSHQSQVQLYSKTIKELKSFAKNRGINLGILFHKEDMVNKIYLWCVEDVYEKLVNFTNITETFQNITHGYTRLEYLKDSVMLLLEHGNLDLIIYTLLSQKFIIKNGNEDSLSSFVLIIRLLLDLSVKSKHRKKRQVIACLIYKFQLENMYVLIRYKSFLIASLNKVQEFRENKKFRKIDWDDSINKFVKNYQDVVTTVLNKNNIPTDVQKHVISKFLYGGELTYNKKSIRRQ